MYVQIGVRVGVGVTVEGPDVSHKADHRVSGGPVGANVTRKTKKEGHGSPWDPARKPGGAGRLISHILHGRIMFRSGSSIPSATTGTGHP